MENLADEFWDRAWWLVKASVLVLLGRLLLAFFSVKIHVPILDDFILFVWQVYLEFTR